MYFFDTETCGLHGPIVLLQYALDDGPISLHEVWREPIYVTLAILEGLANHEGGVCGFNLAFDWFHTVQLYTTLLLLADRVGLDEEPQHHVDTYAVCEAEARDGPCLKPVTACDLMLHARKGPYQSTMDRKDIKIKRVPKPLASRLALELERRVVLKDIYFARRANPSGPKWTLEDCKDGDGRVSKDFVDVVLKFKPSSALKALAVDALGIEFDAAIKFTDIEPRTRPAEVGWAPFAMALSTPERGWRCRIRKGGEWKEGHAWPRHILGHVDHWAYHNKAREYATLDVVYTRDLYRFFDDPEPGDDDSILACMVGAVRWRGFAIDVPGITALRDKELTIAASAPKAPRQVYEYVAEKLSDVEKVVIQESTKKTVLESLSVMTASCPDCETGCDNCEDGLIKHPAGVRAKAVLDARQATYRRQVYDKLLQAGRFHASLKVIGTKSSRMSGTDGLNAQGIDHSFEVRSKFPFATGDLILCGGDFASFEVCIADADYNDATLRQELLTCASCGQVCTPDDFRADVCTGCGTTGEPFRKIHGLFGMELEPGTKYDDVLRTKGSSVKDLYDQGKRGVFSQLYGGNFATLMDRLGIDEEVARRAEQGFANRYKGVGAARLRIHDLFCSMRQPGGIGTNVEWHDPAEYIESLTGFPRYFTLENQICKTLYGLASRLPPTWKGLEAKVVRRDRVQKIGGAVMSALYAAAFNIQSQSMRAAANHVIQSTGATITKDLQRRIWDLQPSGVHEWVVQPLNVHDEVMVPAKPEVHDAILQITQDVITDYRELIPLIKLDWANNITSWAEK